MLSETARLSGQHKCQVSSATSTVQRETRREKQRLVHACTSEHENWPWTSVNQVNVKSQSSASLLHAKPFQPIPDTSHWILPSVKHIDISLMIADNKTIIIIIGLLLHTVSFNPEIQKLKMGFKTSLFVSATHLNLDELKMRTINWSFAQLGSIIWSMQTPTHHKLQLQSKPCVGWVCKEARASKEKGKRENNGKFTLRVHSHVQFDLLDFVLKSLFVYFLSIFSPLCTFLLKPRKTKSAAPKKGLRDTNVSAMRTEETITTELRSL